MPNLPSQADFEWLDAATRPQQLRSFVGTLPIYNRRLRPSTINRFWLTEDFYSDKSRIIFCSSFRRMMQKAQVFSLESNTSVRNRLTHSLEVADIGRTLARKIGKGLETKGLSSAEETECIQCIVESACLMHDIGNPPFGHFGEAAIKNWFTTRGREIYQSVATQLPLNVPDVQALYDFANFDGNPQGFRIVTHLHTDVDEFGLNLTCSTLLASIKYPHSRIVDESLPFSKKIGIFSTEEIAYREVCALYNHKVGRRYFLAYVMELADDICYCLSDIADSFEKGLVKSRDFKEEFKAICKEEGVDADWIWPKKRDTIKNFAYDISIKVAREIMEQASAYFVDNIDRYLDGTAGELCEEINAGKVLKCFKKFSRRFIYTDCEVQRIEIAGSKIVEGLLDHYGRLLRVPRADFRYFVDKGELRKGSNLDTEWRIFNQLSRRMLRVYTRDARGATDEDEWLARAHLIVDHVSGLTDHSALKLYQNLAGVNL
jgi:dGTPase